MSDHDDRHHRHGDRRHDGDVETYFDEQARDWDDQRKVERARVVVAALRSALAVDDTTRVLEYGAGTGLATEHLADGPIGPVTLADPSRGMRAVMADKVIDGRLPPASEILDLDLAADDVDTNDLTGTFDLVLTVMTLHHIPELPRVLVAVAGLLAPDGHLAIVDLVAEDGSFHQHLRDFDGHDGFTPAGLSDDLAQAGLAMERFDVVHHLDKEGTTYPLFLAIARPT